MVGIGSDGKGEVEAWGNQKGGIESRPCSGDSEMDWMRISVHNQSILTAWIKWSPLGRMRARRCGYGFSQAEGKEETKRAQHAAPLQ